MVFIQYFADMAYVQIVLGEDGPGQFREPFEVGANDAGFGRMIADPLQSFQLFTGPLFNLFRHLGGGNFAFHFLD